MPTLATRERRALLVLFFASSLEVGYGVDWVGYLIELAKQLSNGGRKIS